METKNLEEKEENKMEEGQVNKMDENQDEYIQCKVIGIDMFLDTKKFEKLLNSWEIKFSKCKKIAKIKHGIVKFKTEEDFKIASKLMRKQKGYKGMQIQVEKMHKRKRREENESIKKKLCSEEVKDVRDITTPLWRIPYAEQLVIKRDSTEKVLKEIVFAITKECEEPPIWVKEAKDSMCCPFEDIKPSPVTEEYRNKAQFTIGYDINDKPCVGFTGISPGVYGLTADPSNCINITKESKKIRNILQDHVENSDLKPYQKGPKKGFWRQLTVKTFRTGEAMAIIQVKPNEVSKEKLEEEEKKLIDRFIQAKENGIKVDSLVIEHHDGVSEFADYNAFQKVLLGPEYVHEKMMDLSFRVSANAFFQPNTHAAEVLYRIIADWCQEGEDVTVLDICCGTGSIGLCVAKKVKWVIGIEMVQSAIVDARENAKLNDITNIEFICGKAEDILHAVLVAKPLSQNVVAIVDPPRAGLHTNTIRAIRSCDKIKYLIFVSCDRQGLMNNAPALCKPISKKLPGNPFKPVKALGVDLCPHTNGVERVVLFQRE